MSNFTQTTPARPDVNPAGLDSFPHQYDLFNDALGFSPEAHGTRYQFWLGGDLLFTCDDCGTHFAGRCCGWER